MNGLAFALLAAAAAGCAHPAPGEVAARYVRELKRYNFAACYAMLSRQDRSACSLKQFLADVPLGPAADRRWFRPVLAATRFGVGNPYPAGGGRTVVPLEVEAPYLAAWERDLCERYRGPELLQAAARSLEAGNYPRARFKDRIVLVRSRGRWLVWAGMEQRAETAALHRRTLKLYHRQRYGEAEQILRMLIDRLDRSPATGSGEVEFRLHRELARVQKVQSQLATSQAYLSKLALSDVRAELSSQHATGLFGRIANLGDRPVAEVQLTVAYYLDPTSGEAPVYVEQHTALAMPLAFDGFRQPPRPLFPGRSRSFGVTLKAPAEILAKAAIRVTVAAAVLALPQDGAVEVPSAAAKPRISPPGTTAPAPAPGQQHPALTRPAPSGVGASSPASVPLAEAYAAPPRPTGARSKGPAGRHPAPEALP